MNKNQQRLLSWVSAAKEYIEADARNKKYPLAIELIEEINKIEKEFKLCQIK